MAITGMTWNQVLDELDLIRLAAINMYWADHPPVHILIASYLGVKPKPKAKAMNSQSMGELASQFGGLVEGRPNDPMLDLLGL